MLKSNDFHLFFYYKRVLKDGKLVEQGRHADLLALDGEYAKLYRVQAEAFLSDVRFSALVTYITER